MPDVARSQATGQWQQGYLHPTNGLLGWPTTFEAVNLAVVPNISTTSNSNDIVIAWDLNPAQPWPVTPTMTWQQRFVVGNPETASFSNRVVTIPRGPNGIFYGDLFCAGHCWLPDGRLFVAGGNAKYGNQGATNNYLGSQFVAFWDPRFAQVAPTYGWDFDLCNGAAANPRPMRLARWYPTVTLITENLVMVSGGTDDTGSPSQDVWRSYEIFDIAANDWHRDPFSVPVPNLPRLHDGPNPVAFGDYPRIHSLSTRGMFLSGPPASSGRAVHTLGSTPQNWLVPIQGVPGLTVVPRQGGSSVLVPNVGNIPALRDQVMSIGGGRATNNSVTPPIPSAVWADSILVDAGSAAPAWHTQQSLHFPRMVANAVLAPNGDIVLIGGSSDYYWETPWAQWVIRRETEVWDRVNGWRRDATQAAARMYHSTAALLPSGKMVSGGGDYRRDTSNNMLDWEIYVPRYLTAGQAVPLFSGSWANPGTASLSYGTQYLVDHAAMPAGAAAVSHVVLMRPCSTTHHSDMHQQYIELPSVPQDTGVGVMVTMPPAAPAYVSGVTQPQGSVALLPGYYMMFLVTTAGTPSKAKWVLVS